MKNIRLILQFDGKNYHGWQRQKNAVTIQQIVEDKISEIIGEKVTLHASGRTDSGVHAKYFVCNFLSNSSFPFSKLHFWLNDILPSDIRILKLSFCDESFHSRFSAKEKTYTYTIYNKKMHDVFLKEYTWHYKPKIDVDLMKTAANSLIGTHDFKSFMVANAVVKNTIRTVKDIKIIKKGSLISITITADGYLYNMVRIISGTLAQIGSGILPPDSMPKILEAKDRTIAGLTAPAHGLCLMNVKY